jgi:hypothetical protein
MGRWSPAVESVRLRLAAIVLFCLQSAYELVVTFTDVDRGWTGRRRL